MSARGMRKVIARLNAWLEAESRAVTMDELKAKTDELFVAECGRCRSVIGFAYLDLVDNASFVYHGGALWIVPEGKEIPTEPKKGKPDE